MVQSLRSGIRLIMRQTRWSMAFLWRSLMFRTTVIALTGSVGKTTAKECLVGVLSAHGRTVGTKASWNDDSGVARTLLAIRPWHRFAVIEVGTEGPGQIRKKAALVRPDVAVELAVAATHTNMFPTLEDTAAEKVALLDYVSRDGVVILNGDDARVRAMAERCRAKVVFFGLSDDCEFVADDVESAWPERLHFRARFADEQTQVQTQLVGTHWLSSVLAALAVARVCGIPLAAAAPGFAMVLPFAGRMQPIQLPSGAVVIRDEVNGSFTALGAMLKVIGEAQATRRVLVFSDVTDDKARSRHRLRDIGRLAADLVDVAVFVGERGRQGPPAAVEAGMNPEDCHHFPDLRDAAEFLQGALRAGDVVFLEGRGGDHLVRLLLAQFGPIGCWKTDCRLRLVCEACPQLKPSFDLRRVQTLLPGQATPLASDPGEIAPSLQASVPHTDEQEPAARI